MQIPKSPNSPKDVPPSVVSPTKLATIFRFTTSPEFYKTRGFSDAIFGLAVVYAALTMYDAQGVRREVGTHARVLNKVMPRITSQSTSYDTNDVVNSYSRESSSNLENVDPVFSEEHTTFQGKPTTSSILLETQPISSFIKSSNVLSNESESVASALKESIGHTEIEVAAGALLGFVVSLAVSSYL
ncbi:hypothetical protein ACS0TY_032910 [Phlomoides rotata]